MKIGFQIVVIGLLLVNAGCASEREPVLAAEASPPATATDTNAHPINAEVGMFYDALEPYGEWFWLDPYGWVWTPSSVAVTWRPYTSGYWVYADCGWTWVSDFDWGWAPFHYGRWCWHAGYGWCWVPGAVWAPAWVAWHFGDEWCGWAPLPPLVRWERTKDWDDIVPSFSWCFVADRDFCRRHLRDRIVVSARNATLLHETRNVTRFEVRDGHVFNLSLSAEQIARATGRAIPHYQIVDADLARAASARRFTRHEIHVYRPALTHPSTGATARTFAPHRQLRSAPPATAPPMTFNQLRRGERERQRLEAEHYRQHSELERMHRHELQRPSRGVSPMDLHQRQLAEHRALREQIRREDELFESRWLQRYNHPPRELERSLPRHFRQQHFAGAAKNLGHERWHN
jgi:hypothetical protein